MSLFVRYDTDVLILNELSFFNGQRLIFILKVWCLVCFAAQPQTDFGSQRRGCVPVSSSWHFVDMSRLEESLSRFLLHADAAI